MDYPFNRKPATPEQRRKKIEREVITDLATKFSIVVLPFGAVAGIILAGTNYNKEELSSPNIAQRAIIDAGYTNPVHTGVPSPRECRTGARSEGRYFRDAFRATNVNGQQVNLVVCRAEYSSLSTVRISASARYRY